MAITSFDAVKRFGGTQVSKSKQKGTDFESQAVEYISRRLGDDRIERRTLSGVNDRGDIAGVYIRGKRCVVECKNCKRMELSSWLDEAEAERGNDDADFKAVLHKRRGAGVKNFGKNYVSMELDDFLALIVGARNLLE